jgi:hypothetical protein
MVASLQARRLHSAMFLNRTLLRSSISVGTLMLTGDAIAQQYEAGSVNTRSRAARTDRIVALPWSSADGVQRQWNVTRSGRMAIIGVISAGPISHWTYVLCSHFFPGTTWPQLGKRVLAVVTLNAPVQINMTFGLTVTACPANNRLLCCLAT